MSILFWTALLCLGMSWAKHMLRMATLSAASALDDTARQSLVARMDADAN